MGTRLSLSLVFSLLVMSLTALRAGDATSKPQASVPPEFATIIDDPKLPRVLLMGDSVSIAYALEVRKLLTGVANVHRVPANCGSTKVALGYYGLTRWLPEPNEKWDVIHFNHGLHDLSYRFADDRDRNDKGEYASPTNGGQQNVPVEDYEKNLKQIISWLKRTGAKLIFASTTPVPESDVAKYVLDSELPYNAAAKKVMNDEGVVWNDLWSLVKPRQPELQIKRNVHFGAAGSSVMAKQVANVIRQQLQKQTEIAASKNSTPPRDDAAWLHERGTLVFEEAFEREEDGNGLRSLGNGWESATAERAPQIKQADLDAGILKIASDGKAAGHGVHIHHDAGFADGGTTLRFRFPGLNKDESLTVGHVDRELKGVHAGHLCYANLYAKSILLRDHKTGVSEEKLRSRRAEYLARKEKLPPDLEAIVQSKEKTIAWKADNEWHDMTLAFEGDEMRLSIDGQLVAAHRSEGYAHPNKRWLSFSAASTVWIDDVKIWKVPAAKAKVVP